MFASAGLRVCCWVCLGLMLQLSCDAYCGSTDRAKSPTRELDVVLSKSQPLELHGSRSHYSAKCRIPKPTLQPNMAAKGVFHTYQKLQSATISSSKPAMVDFFCCSVSALASKAALPIKCLWTTYDCSARAEGAGLGGCVTFPYYEHQIWVMCGL